MKTVYALRRVYYATDEKRTVDEEIGFYSTEENADKAMALFLLENLDYTENELYIYRSGVDLNPVTRKPL